jgi:hypothetical protein
MAEDKREKGAVEELSDLEFFSKMLKFFGPRRAVEVFGYAAVMGASRKVLPVEIVAALVSFGFSRAGVYRALADIKAFAREVERERGKMMSMAEVIAEINAADKSHKREPVL